MQLLIVHHEAEIGATLLEMVREYSNHAAEYQTSEQAARVWAAQARGCDLLVTQLESESVDGLSLAVSLGEFFPQLHTCFLPAYPLAAQRLELPQTKFSRSRSRGKNSCRRSSDPLRHRERPIFSTSSICCRCAA